MKRPYQKLRSKKKVTPAKSEGLKKEEITKLWSDLIGRNFYYNR